ncbi:MAG: hypothetical protein ACREJM_14005 [Candidatus Saccharimonadales bacterium]
MADHKDLDQLPSKNRLEWVIWKDACNASCRVGVDAVKDVQLVTNANLGWVIHENAERLVLAHGQSTSGEIDHFVIPVNCILERRKVCPPAKRKAPVTP